MTRLLTLSATVGDTVHPQQLNHQLRSSGTPFTRAAPISEDLYRAMKIARLPVGVSVVCPGWVRTSIHQAKRNWPQSLGEVPPPAATAGVTAPHVQRVIAEGTAPAAVADLVADAIAADRFWVFTDPRFTEMALDRWQRIAEGRNPQTEVDLPGFPPAEQLTAEIRRLLAGQGGGLRPPGPPWLEPVTSPARPAAPPSIPREPAA